MKIFTAIVVSILGLSAVASAQTRYRPTASRRASAPSSSASGTSARPPLGRRPPSARPDSATASAGRRPGATRFTVAPPPAGFQRVMDRSVARVLRAAPGNVAAPRGATRESMSALYRQAWNKMMRSEDTSFVENTSERGDELRTYYVDMGRNTGRVTYPAGARGMSQTFTHVVIQLRTTPRGTESLRIFEPGPGPGADAQPMLPRAR